MGWRRPFRPADDPGFNLIFHDEFRAGSTPNPANWLWYYEVPNVDGTNLAEDPDYEPEAPPRAGQSGGVSQAQLTVSADAMHVGGAYTPGGGTRYSALNWDYAVGEARTATSYLPTAGHGFKFEVRARFSAAVGSWGAIWLYPRNAFTANTAQELDLCECPNGAGGYGGASTGGYSNLHWGDYNNVPTSGPFDTGAQFNSGDCTQFRRYVCIWRTTSVDIYWSDPADETSLVHVFNNTTHIPTLACDLNISMQTGNTTNGTWAPTPSGGTGFPCSVDVDYVRIYQE